MEENRSDTIKGKVMGAIESGRVVMRPRWHFVLRIILLTAGIVLVLLAALYLAAFILFGLRETGILFAPLFGPRGWFAFFKSLPWILVAVAALFVCILETLVRRYSFAYRKPLLYSTLAIVAFVLIGGHFMSRTVFEKRWLGDARGGHPPLPGRLYGRHGLPPQEDIHRGRIIEKVPGGFVFEDVLGATSTVIIVFQESRPFAIGDMVIILGKNVGPATIRALDVRPLPNLP